jgi:hypothetical protein
MLVVGAALALTCFEGAAFAAVPDSARARISVAVQPAKPGRGMSAHGNSDAKDHGDDDHPGNGVGLGRLVRDRLTDDQADDLAAELRTCLSDDKVEDMRLGQVNRLVHAAGLNTQELRGLLIEDDDSHDGRGLARLVRGGLADGQADDLAEELRGRLEREDVKDLRLGKLLRAAHACGITPQEFKDLLDGD